MSDDQYDDQHGDQYDDQYGEQRGDRHGGGTPPSGGRWDPLPQGDYDDGATAFVKLPEGGVDALLASSDSPLAAPGHGYVPPQITVTPATTGTDPAATGSWTMPSAPVDGTQWQAPDVRQEPPAHQGYAGYEQRDPYGGAAPYDANTGQGAPGEDARFSYQPGATGQWDFSQAEAEAAAARTAPGQDVTGQDVTGQWSIPVADGDLPDESGEFTTSSLAEQWGTGAPATLPGGAPAPWATQPAGQPWDEGAAEAGPGRAGPATEAPRAPEPAAGPYGQQPPAHPAVETGPATSRDDRTAPGGLGGRGGAEEAPEGPAEPTAERAEVADAEPAPEAAEHPVTASAPRPAPDRGRESGRAPETEPRPDATDDRPDATDTTDPQADLADAADGVDAVDVAAADPSVDQEPAPAGPHQDHPLASYVLRVNGADRPVTDAWIGESLLYVLRERLGLAGAKDGCSQGECGACNVQVDGRLVASCLVPAVTSAGSEVRTVEGLATDGQPSDVQRALARRGAVQCGFCVPGMAMTVHNLLEGNPAPTELEARQALCGNLCRCSGYRGVLEAVNEVVAEREAHTAAEAGGTDADELRIPHQAGPGAGGVNPSAFGTQPPPGTPDAAAPHDQPFGDHGQDGGHA
ncbi:2Fe-2S iron-sulfur cluster-binding protein [Streptomyces sp. BBFR51]|uniref:(2Fe-2S)-binding protein n=1 Tax=Streptomyces sp. BBFR51 TaxID=3372856 RepID=UPI0037DD745C